MKTKRTMKFQTSKKINELSNMIEWALLLPPCQLQSHGLWYSKKQLCCLFRQRVTLHFAHTWHAAPASIAHHKWKMPNPVFSNVTLGMTWHDLPLFHRRRRQTGRPPSWTFPAEIKLSDNLAMKVLSLSGRSFS